MCGTAPIGVAHSGIDTIEQVRPHNGEPEAAAKPEQDQPRPHCAHGFPRHGCGVQNADVGNGARLRQTRFLISLLGHGIEILGHAHGPTQPSVLDGPRGDLPQAPRVRAEPPVELRLPGQELIPQPARQRRNRLPLQRGDVPGEALYGRVLVGVTVLQGAQAGPLRGQLRQRGGEVGVRLDGPDHRERVGREARRVTGLRQHPLQRLPVLLGPLPVELHIEEGAELGIGLAALGHTAGPAGPTRRTERHRGRPIARQRDRPLPEALERRLGAAQVALRALQLLRQDLRELCQLLPLEVRRHLHVAFRHRVDHRGDPRRIGAPQLEPEEVPFHIHLRAQRVRQRARRVAQGRQIEVDGPVGRERLGHGGPGEPEPGPDGVTQRPALDHLALRGGGERVSPTIRIHRQTIRPRAVLTGYLERRQDAFVRPRLRAHEQPLVADHVVEHNV